MTTKLILIAITFLSQQTFAQGPFVSDFHKDNGGKIVFNKEASPDLKSAKDFGVDFDSKDDITAYVFMKNTIDNYQIADKASPDKLFKSVEKKYYIKYFIDDEEQKMNPIPGGALNGQKDGFTAFAIRVLRKNGNVDHNDFRNKVLKLSGGKHKIRVEMWGGNSLDNSTKEPIAKGEFTLDKIEFVAPSIGAYNTIKAQMINSDLENQALKLVTQQSAVEGLGSKYSKPKIADSDWAIVKNNLTSAIMYRTISIVFYEVNSKGICKAIYFYFKQDYTGAGKYSNTLIYNGVGTSNRVDCE